MLSLERFGQILGISPLELNQLIGTGCGQPMFQYAWQHPGRIGREDLAYAIQHAEDLVTDFLGFYPGVVWTEEVFPTPVRAKNAITISGLGMFIEGGKRAVTLIEEDAPVAYSDEDDDDFDELATIVTTVATGTNPEEIQVFYPGKGGAEEWEIRPLDISVVGTTASITGKRWQFVLEAAQETIEPTELDRTDDAFFLEEVDVYRVYNDPSEQAQFEGYRSPCYACNSTGCVACEEVVQTACIRSLAPEQGVLTFIPSTWNAELSAFYRADWACSMSRPLRTRAWIRSGWQDPRRVAFRRTHMDPRVERAIALLTMATIGPEGLCTCLTHIHERWAIDRAYQESGTEQSTSYKLGTTDYRNVFGTTNGGYEAWRLLREVRNGRSAG